MVEPLTYSNGSITAQVFPCDAKYAIKCLKPRTVNLALFSTPYPETRNFTMSVEGYLRHWLPERIGSIAQVMADNSVIMQNIWFPRTAEGWYDERIFEIPRLYRAWGFNMVDPHPWDKINAPPAGNHKRYDHNEFEFIFTFANGPDYTYNKFRKPYKPKTVAKAGSGNMRKPGVTGTHAGGHARLNAKGAAQGNIYRFSPTGGKEVYRPRIAGGVFPVALAERAILQYSNPGDLVADFFCGTGTSLYVAIQNNRKAVGFDIELDNVMTTINWLREIRSDHRNS